MTPPEIDPCKVETWGRADCEKSETTLQSYISQNLNHFAMPRFAPLVQPALVGSYVHTYPFCAETVLAAFRFKENYCTHV